MPLRLVNDQTSADVVIVGAGFGGLAAAKSLGRRKIGVTLIDKRNHHLFQPLLYQVATAALSPADIAAPIRTILKDYPTVHVRMDEVTGVDPAARLVRTANGADIPFSALVLATGARHSYFGNDHWAAHAPGIKTLDDAVRVRRDILLSMERAETMRQQDPAWRSVPITFAVVGGGPTGVEMAGAIAELARHAAAMDFRFISPTCVKVVLIEGGERLLAAFPPRLSAAAKASLEQLGVEVRLLARVSRIDGDGIEVNGEHMAAAATIWAAGVEASPAARWLAVKADRSGRVPVGPTLDVAGLADVFAIGDTAAVKDAGEQIVPGIAAAAKQQGLYVAAAIAARRAGRRVRPFRYRHYGSLATIGRRHAVADLGWAQLRGFAAWLLWSTAHLYFLVGFRNRFVVGANWIWNYLTFERGARLITGHELTAGREDAPVTKSSALAN